MNNETVVRTIIAVLQRLREDIEYAEQVIEPTTCPAKDLSWFDSLMWPVSTTMLEEELGFEIPDHLNLFKADDGSPLSVKQAATKLLTYHNEKGA